MGYRSICYSKLLQRGMDEMSTYPWLTQRNGTYYLRAAVPNDIQESVGASEIWRSLRTKDKRVAVDRLRVKSAEIVSLFSKHRESLQRFASNIRNELTDDELQTIEDTYFAHIVEEDEELRLEGLNERNFNKRVYDLSWLGEMQKSDYARGKMPEYVLSEAEEVLQWDGIEINLSPKSPSWPKLVRRIFEATLRASSVIRQRNEGEVIKTPPWPSEISSTQVKPTLEDAKNFYIAENVSGSEFFQKKRKQRLEALMRRVAEALGEVPALPDWTIDDAYKLRDSLLAKGTLKPTSVRRELNDIKGIFSLYKKRRLPSMDNPFAGLELPKSAISDKEVRSPLPEAVIDEVSALIRENANPDLKLIWRLLVGTGCRLGEITGLRVQDIVIDDELPHLKIVEHEARRLKNSSSRREIPLVGDALKAAQEAVRGTAAVPFAFPRYSGDKGPNAASQTLIKWIRKVTEDKRHVVHSLRHNMADRLDAAGVHPNDKYAILGHLTGGSSERYYGSVVARRRVLARAMERAFGSANVSF